MYFETMKTLFKKIPVELPKPPLVIGKNSNLYYMLLEVVGYMNKLNEKLPPLNKRKPRKKAQENEDKIKINLQTTNQNWNYWKFQIHWNKLEWVNPRNCN